MTSFQEAILEVVRSIPVGKVASYGQVAAYVGIPRAARQVGWAMSSMESVPDFPWWRVLNKTGTITIKGNQFSNARLQKELLEAEGVVVSPDYTLDMARYCYRADPQTLQTPKLQPNDARELQQRFDLG